MDEIESGSDSHRRGASELDDGQGPPFAPLLVGVAIFAALALTMGWLLLDTEDDPFTYAVPLSEVVSDPELSEGREIRVEGLLREGTMEFRQDPCGWRFVLYEDDLEMLVFFPECVVPDTFRDGPGITVTVRGKYANGVLVASEVVPQCASHYDEADTGRTPPHTYVPSTPSANTQ